MPSLPKSSHTLRLAIFAVIAAISFVTITGALSMKSAKVQMEITHLVTEEQKVTFDFTTYTSGTIPEYQYSKVNSLGRAVTLHFTLTNTTESMKNYFEYLTIKCRVKSTTGSFNQQVSVTFDGTRVTDATVSLPTTYSIYDLKVSGGYTSKGLAGKKTIVVGVWATET